jgi:uncharacterized membrane protein YoaT (DUF817 family)
MKNKTTTLLIAFTLFLLAVSFLAYNRLIPHEIKAIPFYDSIGHFLLFGLLGLIAHYAFNRKRVPVFGRVIPLGPTLAIAYAFIDESLQVLSHNRTFDLGDLFFGLLGIFVFITAAWVMRNLRNFDFKFLTVELFFLVLKEARALIFPLLFMVVLFLSNYVSIPGIYRYDLLFVVTVLIQVLLVAFKLETKDEAKTIFLFHIIGLCLELFKTHPSVASWSYPEMGYLKIGTVPLYSGFMYAAVGSFIAQSWKIFKLELTDHPSYKTSIILCAFIYLNFFTNHFIHDFRTILFVAIFVAYYKTNVHYRIREKPYRMPLILSFILIGFFVWVAENIATFYGAWKYPGQIHEWQVVSFQKITSWFLLVIICFIVVAYLKHFKKKKQVVILDA